ncbi:hypothetical protein BJV74DRAFT_817212 [Russula compacta]|nr:hypothetical protein BJV74DRAFT_817212 [Russula compacta]
MDVQSSLNILQSTSSSPSSAIVPALSSNPPPPLPAHPPTSEEIDAVIQQATSSVSSDGRHIPLKDTRTQLFVGNVRFFVASSPLSTIFFATSFYRLSRLRALWVCIPPVPCSSSNVPFAIRTGADVSTPFPSQLSRFTFFT